MTPEITTMIGVVDDFPEEGVDDWSEVAVSNACPYPLFSGVAIEFSVEGFEDGPNPSSCRWAIRVGLL